MKKFDFIICYDISDKKRLPKVARTLEKVSIRIQKSVFLYPEATKTDIKNLSNIIKEIIDEQQDDIRIYKINKKESINLKSALDLKNPNILYEL